jgi:hypothetical protein
MNHIVFIVSPRPERQRKSSTSEAAEKLVWFGAIHDLTSALRFDSSSFKKRPNTSRLQTRLRTRKRWVGVLRKEE